MGSPAAKAEDHIEGVSILIVMVPTPAGDVPTPLPFDFDGIIDGDLSENVRINGRPAAMLTSTAQNTPEFEEDPRPGNFQAPPSNKGIIISGSPTVNINGRPAAREGDTALIAELDAEAPLGEVTVIGVSNVMIGE